jgi:hypothetical protein
LLKDGSTWRIEVGIKQCIRSESIR